MSKNEAIEKLAELLMRIDEGKVPILEKEREEAREGMFSEVTFHVEGWVISVFNDAGGFDYIDTATAPDGQVLIFDDLWNSGVHYRPPLGSNIWWEGCDE